MDKKEKRDTSKRPNGDQKKVPYSPTKDLVDLARLETEKNVKAAEAKCRMIVYERFVAVRKDVFRNDPVVNNVHIRQFENDQLDEAFQRYEEIRGINNKITKTEERVREKLNKK